jgi:carboxylesterase type B
MGLRVLVALVAPLTASVVTLPNGLKLKGIAGNARVRDVMLDDLSVDQYLGIPFAEPPTGELRFRPPQPFTKSWNDVKEFAESPPGCATGKDGTSEDCLYLNVFRPSNIDPDERLPVMIWIFGGGFTNGKIDLYNGTELASRHRVIVVVPAYRVGMFGFFASPETMKESGTTGNWGILDQRMALQWVQTNIASFGGDASRVVIFGQSAGAFSVAAHLVSPGSQGLFSAAILSSPTVHSSFFFQDMEDSVKFSEWAATTLGRCTIGDLQCLRSVPTSQLVVRSAHRDLDPPAWASRLFPMMPWGLTMDGVVISGTPLDMARQGKVANVPVIMGVTQDEGTIFALLLNQKIRPKHIGDISVHALTNITMHFTGNETIASSILSEFHSTFTPFEESINKPYEALPNEAAKIEAELNSIKSRDISDMTFDELSESLPTLVKMSISPDPGPPNPRWDKRPFNFYVNTIRDSVFACPVMDFAEAVSAANGGRVWVYNFALDVWADTPWIGTRLAGSGAKDAGNMTIDDLGAYHAGELPFIWNSFSEKNLMPTELANPTLISRAYTSNNFCPADSFKRTVADQVGCLWTNMATCGSPECRPCGLAQAWDTFKAGPGPSHMHIKERGVFEMTSRGNDIPSAQQCAIWKDTRIPFVDLSAPEKPALVRAWFSTDASAGSENAFLTMPLILALITHI